MSIKSISLMVLGCLALGGCAMLKSPRELNPGTFIDPAQARQLLQDKDVCCQQLSELNYPPLADKKRVYVPLSADSQVYDFSSGKSFVQAYMLTSNVSKLKIVASSLIYDTVLAPNLMLLDRNFNVTRTISADKFVYVEAGMTSGDHLSAEFTIFRPQPNNPANETYLLFYTSPQAMSGSTTIVHPAKAFARSQQKDIPNIPDPIIPHSAMGLIELKLDFEGTESDGDNAYIPILEPSKESISLDSTQVKGLTVITEQTYNAAIQQAVAEEDLDKAMVIVDEAEAAGSKTARPTFIKAIKK